MPYKVLGTVYMPEADPISVCTKLPEGLLKCQSFERQQIVGMEGRLFNITGAITPFSTTLKALQQWFDEMHPKVPWKYKLTKKETKPWHKLIYKALKVAHIKVPHKVASWVRDPGSIHVYLDISSIELGITVYFTLQSANLPGLGEVQATMATQMMQPLALKVDLHWHMVHSWTYYVVTLAWTQNAAAQTDCHTEWVNVTCNRHNKKQPDLCWDPDTKLVTSRSLQDVDILLPHCWWGLKVRKQLIHILVPKPGKVFPLIRAFIWAHHEEWKCTSTTSILEWLTHHYWMKDTTLMDPICISASMFLSPGGEDTTDPAWDPNCYMDHPHCNPLSMWTRKTKLHLDYLKDLWHAFYIGYITKLCYFPMHLLKGPKHLEPKVGQVMLLKVATFKGDTPMSCLKWKLCFIVEVCASPWYDKICTVAMLVSQWSALFYVGGRPLQNEVAVNPRPYPVGTEIRNTPVFVLRLGNELACQLAIMATVNGRPAQYGISLKQLRDLMEVRGREAIDKINAEYSGVLNICKNLYTSPTEG
ncbi:unnamed protein product [Notodromas monacha]|uniref:Uncharacterized protein n=1 Tax=Notodromas monacha TaxID=399045 RepID=A0A7R9G7X6_9CRUS|nr:unnamed protein product [Notodromas monacha]CAG0912531.1 unnamed protein product [Notodromas monacha]